MVLTRTRAWSAHAEQTPTATHHYCDYIQWPVDPPDRQTMGGKAAVLAALGNTFPIPAWFVVTPAALLASLSDTQRAALIAGQELGNMQMSQAVVAAITQAVATLDDDPHACFAVRSSATAEDGQKASFAGQLASYLQVERNNIFTAVCHVWQSAFADHVTYYRQQLWDKQNGAAPTTWLPAVLIQRMVDADVAGVAFGADPVTGDRRHCIITATRGLADGLVSGRVNGESYRVERQGKVLQQQKIEELALLSPGMIQAIIMLLTQVEAQLGAPQDIEWAFADGQLYLLQARPITTLPVNSMPTPTNQGPLTIWDNSNIVESYSGVTAPLTFSFARHVYAHVYVAFCRQMGVSAAQIEAAQPAFRNLLGYLNGHVYYNLLNWYRILALFPGFQSNRHFMEQMMGVKEGVDDKILATLLPQQPTRWARLVDGWRLARAGLGLLGSQLTLRKTIARFYARLDRALPHTTDELQRLSLTELVADYRTVERQLLTQWDAPLINDFLCMIAFGLSRQLLARQGGEQGLQLHSDLLIGQGDIISAEPAQRLTQMAVLAAQDPGVVEALLHAPPHQALAALATLPDLAGAYHAYLAKFGNRCMQELKLESPTLVDDPTSLLRAIGQMATHRPSAPTTLRPASTSASQALAALYPRQPLRRWLTGQVVAWAKARVRDRENLRFERTRVFGYARQLFLAMGQRLCEAGLLDQPRQIFLLEVEEVLRVAEGTSTTYDLRGLIALRQAEQQRFAALPSLPNRVQTAGLTVTALATGIDQPLPKPPVDDTTRRQGIGCCAGVVQAPVRVITDPRQASLQAGEILVARFTDPGWITLFANAAGILVERGSLLSHSAIVARELGIPAIVAIDGLLEWLETGDVVEMNGATGTVQLRRDDVLHDA